MTTLVAALPALVWKSSPRQWATLALAAAALGLCFYPALEFMVANWRQVEEYSYGWFIPFISAFLVWQRSETLRRHEFAGSWAGVAVILAALLLGAVGQLSAIRMLSQYGFVLGVVGLALAAVGWRGTLILAVPMAILLFMIPLPQFLLREVSQSLQLVSSQLGVALIRALGISVFLEGNVIDLGGYKLQVVEACSGLRYLFPLLVLGCLAACFFQAALWKRWLVIASTVPLTIVMNSLRIGLIGVTVEHWGPTMADGLLHDLEGGFMFLVCLALLLAEMALLASLGPGWQSLRTIFGLELPRPPAQGTPVALRRPSAPLSAAGLVLTAAAGLTLALPPSGAGSAPPRKAYSEFPLEIEGGWSGRTERLAPGVVAWLAVTDYFLANYRQGSLPWVNFYSAYYASQSGGESSHSPRTCIPGDGWAILDLREVELPLSAATATPGLAATLRVNRALVQKGEQRQLVYYWFRQRGRNLTDEFQVKWFILRDALVRDRSDGALMRLITPLAGLEDASAAERRLSDFVRRLDPLLADFVPG